MPLGELPYFQHTQSYNARLPQSFPLFSAPKFNASFIHVIDYEPLKITVMEFVTLSDLIDGHIDFFGIDEVSNSNCFTLINN